MSFSSLLIHKVNTYNVGFNGADDYNNPIRKIKKDTSLSNLNCRVQRQITKEKAYSLSEIENMMPFERQVYVSLLMQYLEQVKNEQEKQKR